MYTIQSSEKLNITMIAIFCRSVIKQYILLFMVASQGPISKQEQITAPA
jgi:hypothetical protein